MARRDPSQQQDEGTKTNDTKRRYSSPTSGRPPSRAQPPRVSESPTSKDFQAQKSGIDFDLKEATRDELEEMATELNIDDYETMSRSELVHAIRERS